MAGRDHEEDSVDRHADDPDPLFTVLEAGVDLLEPVRILNRRDGISKVDAVPVAILSSLGGIPLLLHPERDY
jgi:hypothetical protein